jgi:hypothetical protein
VLPQSALRDWLYAEGPSATTLILSAEASLPRPPARVNALLC